MVIVYNSDERFAGIFATSVLSLFENNKDTEEITVYLIENGVSEESKAKFQQIARSYGRTIITLPMPDLEKLAGVEVVIPGYNRMATCGRLFIASLLPESIDKVIYADCDTVFVDSIEELWERDISGHPVGMTDGAQNMAYRKLLGLSGEGIYFNSGLLLINLKLWREEQSEQAFIDYIVSRNGYVTFPDEGVLNAVFDGRIKLLPLRYNAITAIFAFSYEELCHIKSLKDFYSPQEVEEAKKSPVMVHFTNNFYMPLRPWMKGCVHPYTQSYLKYRNMTPWREEPLWEDSRSMLKKLYTGYCHKVPKAIFVMTSNIINVHLTPMMHRYKKWRHSKKE